jgi:hypothetical protein
VKFLVKIHNVLGSYKLFAFLFPITIITTIGLFLAAFTYKVIPGDFKVLIVLVFLLLSINSIIRLIKTIKTLQ